MGYQETILHIKGRRNQSKFIKELCKNYGSDWNSLAEPDFIIEIKTLMDIKLKKVKS